MAEFLSKYSGSEIDELLSRVANGSAGGDGGEGSVGPQGPAGADGKDGVSIISVVQTTTSSADGGSNVMTVTLSDGKTFTFTVKNGSKGSQGEKGDKGDTGAEGPQGVQGIQGIQGPKGDTGADGAQGPKGDQGEQGPKGDKGDKGDTGAAGTNGTNGKDGSNGATFTPSVDANGNLSWTNNGGLSNPPTVNIKGPKGDSGSGGGSSSGGGAYAEVNHGTSDTTFTLTSNTFHVWDEVASLDLSLGSEIAGVANEFVFQFTSGSTPTTLILPDDLKWVNDSTPVISENKIYQVSILKGMATILEFNNNSSLIVNRGTYDAGDMMSGASLTFEYPVASDLTLAVLYYESNSVVLPKGQTSITLDYFEPVAPEVVGIIPEQDGTYIYEIV